MSRTLSLPKPSRTPTIAARTGRLLELALVAAAVGFWAAVAVVAPPALVALVLAWALGIGLLLAVPFAAVWLAARVTAASEDSRRRTAGRRARPATR